MLHISTDIRNLAVKAGIEHTGELLNWLKAQYGTISISTTYTNATAIDKLLSQIENIVHSYNLKISDTTLLTFATIKNNIIIN